MENLSEKQKKTIFFLKKAKVIESVMDGYGFFPHLVNIQSNHLVLSKADPSKWSTHSTIHITGDEVCNAIYKNTGPTPI